MFVVPEKEDCYDKKSCYNMRYNWIDECSFDVGISSDNATRDR
jgi:hypothetical protein